MSPTGSKNAPEARARERIDAMLLEDSANLPDPRVLAEEIADDLRNALEQIKSVLGDLNERVAGVEKVR